MNSWKYKKCSRKLYFYPCKKRVISTKSWKIWREIVIIWRLRISNFIQTYEIELWKVSGLAWCENVLKCHLLITFSNVTYIRRNCFHCMVYSLVEILNRQENCRVRHWMMFFTAFVEFWMNTPISLDSENNVNIYQY